MHTGQPSTLYLPRSSSVPRHPQGPAQSPSGASHWSWDEVKTPCLSSVPTQSHVLSYHKPASTTPFLSPLCSPAPCSSPDSSVLPSPCCLSVIPISPFASLSSPVLPCRMAISTALPGFLKPQRESNEKGHVALFGKLGSLVRGEEQNRRSRRALEPSLQTALRCPQEAQGTAKGRNQGHHGSLSREV